MDYKDRDDFKRQMLEFIKEDEKDYFVFEIEEKYTLKLASYVSMLNDLHFLVGAANKLIEIHEKYLMPEDNFDLIVEPALWYSSIVIYARLFTEAFDRRSKLEENEVFDGLDEQTNSLYRTHKEILTARNTFVAHRGDSEIDNLLILAMIPKSGDLSKSKIDVKTVRAYSRGTKYFIDYLILFKKLYDIVDDKRKKQGEKLSRFINDNPKESLKPIVTKAS